jgi:glycine cleavage system H protein
MDMSELRFDESHTWVRDEGKEVIIGITAYAQDQLGSVIFVELPAVGAEIETEEMFGSIESAKAVEDLVGPISGVVTRVNEELADMPELVNDDCYGEGWMIAVKPTDSTELSKLMSYDEYMTTVEDESGDADDDDEDDDLFFSDDDDE